MRRVTQSPATTVAVLSQAVGPVSVRTAILTMTAGASIRVQDTKRNVVQGEQLVNQMVLAVVAHRVHRQDHLQDPRQDPHQRKNASKVQVGQLV